MTRREWLTAAAALAVLAIAGVLLWQVPDIRYFYGFPSGGIWANYAADASLLLLGAVFASAFRTPLRRVANWAQGKVFAETHRLLAEVHGRLDGIEEHARAARVIAADTHKALTQQDHPAAPPEHE